MAVPRARSRRALTAQPCGSSEFEPRASPIHGVDRSAVMRSNSCKLKRHGRILPSAVMRSREHCPQNGRVTGAMMPMRAGPVGSSAKRYVSEVECGSVRGAGMSDAFSDARLTI